MSVNHNDPAAVAEFAASILKTYRHLFLATADNSGQPWVVPVGKMLSAAGELYWQSNADTRHSRNLLQTDKASAVLYTPNENDGEAALYLEGTAKVVDGAEPPGLKRSSGYSLYQFTITGAWINDETYTKTEVDTNLLSNYLKGDK